MSKSRIATSISNHVQQIREDQLLSKAELARRAGVSPLTIDRIEAGKECRLDTKRKIILGLGLSLVERRKVFGDSGATVTAAATGNGSKRNVPR